LDEKEHADYQNGKLKKLVFLELSVLGEDEFLKRKTLNSQKVHSYETFELVDNEQFENGTLYEILNYK
jgi:hypothetical protein